jgi:hypothetical protein
MSSTGWMLLMYLSLGLLVTAGIAEQVLLIQLRKERASRGVGSWKDLFTSAGTILRTDQGVTLRTQRWNINRLMVIAAVIGAVAGVIGAVGLLIDLFGLQLLRF